MRTIVAALVLALVSLTLLAQEETRRVAGQGGSFTKHLTMNQVDTWEIECKAGEVLTAFVSSRQFDPVLKLQGPGGVLLQEVDDEGSESRIAQRLEAAGTYKILVHAFRHAGGGNYALQVDRFAAKEVSLGEETVGRLDRGGRDHLRFQARKGQVLVARFTGQEPTHGFLDPQGRDLAHWEGSVMVKLDGEHLLRLQGAANQTYAVSVLEGVESVMNLDGSSAATMAPGALHLWTFDGEPGDLRLVELVCDQPPAARLIYLVPDEKEGGRLLDHEVPELRELPVASKGRTLRAAAVLGRRGRFQLQLRSRAWSDQQYTVALSDPSEELRAGEARAALPVGGTRFYRCSAPAGELLDLELRSPAFDSLLRLFDFEGQLIEMNDDGGGNLDSHMRHLVRRGGIHYVQVSSHGDGGGGAFELQRSIIQIPTLAVGERRSSELGVGAREIWNFQGRAGSMVIASVRATTLDPSMEVLSPDGVTLGQDDDGGVGRDSLLPLELPQDGLYTLIIKAVHGSGAYTLRLIEGD